MESAHRTSVSTGGETKLKRSSQGFQTDCVNLLQTFKRSASVHSSRVNREREQGISSYVDKKGLACMHEATP